MGSDSEPLAFDLCGSEIEERAQLEGPRPMLGALWAVADEQVRELMPCGGGIKKLNDKMAFPGPSFPGIRKLRHQVEASSFLLAFIECRPVVGKGYLSVRSRFVCDVCDEGPFPACTGVQGFHIRIIHGWRRQEAIYF